MGTRVLPPRRLCKPAELDRKEGAPLTDGPPEFTPDGVFGRGLAFFCCLIGRTGNDALVGDDLAGRGGGIDPKLSFKPRGAGVYVCCA